jgi:hypothetical protein
MLKEVAFVAFAAVVAWGQTPAPSKAVKPFVAKEYPAGKFQVTKNDYTVTKNGDITVRVIDVKNLGYVSPPLQCRAWVEVLKGNQLIKRFYYDDIEPVGFSFGAFVPRQQTAPDYFMVVKEGDYDGRLLLIDKDGGVVDLPGGFYFVTADGKYVISEYASDDNEPAFTVFDLVNHHIVLQPKDTPEIGSWYRDDSGYFFIEYEKPGHAQRLDLENHRLVKISVSENDRKNATKVRYDFDPRKKQDCTSVQQ